VRDFAKRTRVPRDLVPQRRETVLAGGVDDHIVGPIGEPQSTTERVLAIDG
jgi:hypothetical protein